MPGRPTRHALKRFYKQPLMTAFRAFCDNIPKDLCPAEVSGKYLLILKDFMTPIEIPTVQLNYILLEDAIPEKDKWALSVIHHQDNGYFFLQAIKDGQALIVSDGSYQANIVTAGLIATRINVDDFQITACLQVPGTPKQQTPYRGKLGGIFGELTLIQAICLKHNIKGGSVTCALDGELAMKEAIKEHPLRNTAPPADLLQAICHKVAVIKKNFSVDISF